MERAVELVRHLGSSLTFLVSILLASYIGWKYYNRRRFIQQLRVARVSPEQLMNMIDSGEDVAIVDLRNALELESDGRVLPSAIWIDPATLEIQESTIPRDKEVVLYCSDQTKPQAPVRRSFCYEKEWREFVRSLADRSMATARIPAPTSYSNLLDSTAGLDPAICIKVGEGRMRSYLFLFSFTTLVLGTNLPEVEHRTGPIKSERILLKKLDTQHQYSCCIR